uniref:Uncharacterized protein n=1 Tax=Vibrio phage P018-4 TaxID=3229728 RepID=A0AB39AJP2_9CAUD
MKICIRFMQFVIDLETYCNLSGIDFDYDYDGELLKMTFKVKDRVINNQLTYNQIVDSNIDLSLSWFSKVKSELFPLSETFLESLHQGQSNLHVAQHKVNHKDYKPSVNWNKFQIKK